MRYTERSPPQPRNHNTARHRAEATHRWDDGTRWSVGGLTGTWRYDPWGSPVGAPPDWFGFAGELQGAGGDVYLRARWYAPQHGVFTARDPFPGWNTQPASQHPYVYALNNPVVYTDPSGWCVGAECKAGQDLAAEARCRARGGIWIAHLQLCKGGGQFPPPLNGEQGQTDSRSPRGAASGLLADCSGGLAFRRGVQEAVGQVVVAAIALQLMINPLSLPTVPGTPPFADQERNQWQGEYVADSNIFMDRVEGGVNQRNWIDRVIINNPGVTLFVPDTAFQEATHFDPFGTQAQRLANGPNKARIVRVADGDLSVSFDPNSSGSVDIRNLSSRTFNEADMRIVRRAQEMNLPLLTTNAAIRTQIFQSNIPQRLVEFGSVVIIIPP